MANEPRAPTVAAPGLFYELFRHSSNVIEITDAEGRYVDVNPAFERIYGWPREELIGRKPNLIKSPRTSPETFRALWADLLDPSKGEWQGEIVNLDRWGREHPVLLSVSAIRGGDGAITHFIGVATDLTELKGLQLRTIRTERLASLGQLAAGVAHELNTPLANILLIAESLERRAPNPWVANRAGSIVRQVESAARIVAGLLDFGREHPPATREENLTRLVEEAVEFVRGKQKSVDVEVTVLPEGDAVVANVNRVQIVQVFVNLLNNAYDAMEGRGRLTVRTRSTEGFAEIDIHDSGPGIAPEVLPHLFEPFFTTKVDGKGTGLGLSICHGIVASHGGRITVRSAPGEGATFTVRLPRAGPGTVSVETPAPAAGTPALSGTPPSA